MFLLSEPGAFKPSAERASAQGLGMLCQKVGLPVFASSHLPDGTPNVSPSIPSGPTPKMLEILKANPTPTSRRKGITRERLARLCPVLSLGDRQGVWFGVGGGCLTTSGEESRSRCFVRVMCTCMCTVVRG